MIISPYLEEEQKAYLVEKWQEAAGAYPIKPKQQEEIWDLLYAAYADWNRHYHNLSHLYNLLQLADKWEAQLQDKALVQMAIFFHDVEYNPKSKDNERLSAQFARQQLRRSLGAKKCKQLEQYILSTVKHAPLLDEPDCRLFLDFDLAILGQSWSIYEEYARAVQKEYVNWYNFLFYKQGRRKAMKSFLDRPQIYYSAGFREQYEEQARENIDREISQ
ncbi:hypothetical protein SapgrDRAFT_0610 [Saprospira grandis DSM 2844]|uniref:Metal-dependent HD superfamily phosphohydrolase n=1 Tax=Saprospira grandis DSM 2844 TaxID=694433 RepID=J1I237_9BACT|nr:hypothetical protein [Saprospira grandis]EJF52353.1 hypothetical protein SapgrDRAFT_0610 [Saprospira grandis DSM 2844]